MTHLPGGPPARLRPGVGLAAVGLAAVGVSTAALALYARVEAPLLPLGFVALVPWLWALDGARRAGEAAALAWALSVAFCAAVFGWFPLALHRYTQVPLWGGWAVVLAAAPLLQPQWLVCALARHTVRRAGAGGFRVEAATALAYVGTEWALPKLFADTLGHGLHASAALRQGADVAGVHGLTLVLLLANACALAAVRAGVAGFRAHRGSRQAGGLGAASPAWGGLRAALPALVGLALLPAALGAYGALRLRHVRTAAAGAPSLRVGVVQANLTGYAALREALGSYGAVRTILDTHYALSDPLLAGGQAPGTVGAGSGAPPDVLVWPETVYPTTFGSPRSEAGAELDEELAAWVTARGLPLVFGAYDTEDGREYNAAMLLAPARRGRSEFSAYRKAHPFPLTEWVPGPLDTPWLRRTLPWLGTWAPGPGPEVVPLPLRDGRTLKVAPLICYDVLFPGDVARAAREGAELLVTLSNDAWFSGTPAPRLHLVVAAFRSVETRLPQVRATTSGISALVDASGEVVAHTALDTRAVLSATLAPAPRPVPTLARAWGDWLGPVALLLAAGLLLHARARARAPAPTGAPAGA